MLLSPTIVQPLAAVSIDALTLDHLTSFLEEVPETEILLVGCGEEIAFFPEELRQVLRDRKIIIELMGTGSAARTYNVLLAEDRRIAAALIAIS